MNRDDNGGNQRNLAQESNGSCKGLISTVLFILDKIDLVFTYVGIKG